MLKSNSTSFIFNNIFCEMNIKKVIHLGGAVENGGTVLISSGKCNCSIGCPSITWVSKQYPPFFYLLLVLDV